MIDLISRAADALGELADFLRNDGKSPPGLTGAGGLDACIQGQQIGLERDLVDHRDDLGYFRRGLLDGAHGGNRLRDDQP